MCSDCISVPARYILVVLVFFGTWTSYMLRTNISIAIIAMTEQRSSVMAGNSLCSSDSKPSASYSEGSNSEDREDLYKWSNMQQGHILGVYFLGYILTSMPGRWFTRRYGPKWIVGVSTLVSGVLTILVPILAKFNLIALIVARGLTGFAAGFMFPGMHTCITLWAPPAERKKFVWGLLGGTLGTAINWPICALIIKLLSWEMVFYITGGLAVAWSIFWMLLIYDSPVKHPRISDAERTFITSSIGVTAFPIREKKVPWGKVLKSPPILCLLFLHFCNMWNINFLLIEGPKYMIQVLGYAYLMGAILASVPYICRLIMGFIFSAFINYIIYERELLSIIATRKVFTFISHCLPGILLIVVSFIDCERILIVALMIISMSLNGAAVGGVLANAYDLSPNHASKIFNMVNCITMLSGLIIAEVVGIVTNNEETMKCWQIIIMVNAVLYLASGILFLIFASAQVQIWNDLGDQVSDEEDNTQGNQTSTGQPQNTRR